jgi:hypothetical protein
MQPQKAIIKSAKVDLICNNIIKFSSNKKIQTEQNIALQTQKELPTVAKK